MLCINISGENFLNWQQVTKENAKAKVKSVDTGFKSTKKRDRLKVIWWMKEFFLSLQGSVHVPGHEYVGPDFRHYLFPTRGK